MDNNGYRARPWMIAAAKRRLAEQVERLESLRFPWDPASEYTEGHHLAASEVKHRTRRAVCEYLLLTEGNGIGEKEPEISLSIPDPVGAGNALPDWL